MANGTPFAPCTFPKQQRELFELPAEVIEKCNEWVSAYYQAQIADMSAKSQFYLGQLSITHQAFWIVAAICISGLLFSGYQLLRATKLETNEIEASLKSVKVRSAYVGVVVLVLSLAFFFIFFSKVFVFTFGES